MSMHDGRWITTLGTIALACTGVRADVLPAWINEPTTAVWQRVVDDAEGHKLQVVLRWPDDDGDGYERWAFRDGAEYFYPASTIKLCAAVAALEKLNGRIETTGAELSAATPLAWPGEEASTTLGADVRRIFVVSDNPAFNRLYDFCGRTFLNERMAAWGLEDSRITHRLSVARTPEENRRTPEVRMVNDEGDLLAASPAARCDLTLSSEGMAGLRVGTARMSGGERLDEPIDFTFHNAASLDDLQRALVAMTDERDRSMRLTRAQRALLVEAATMLPRDSTDPAYDPETYTDDYVKFLLPGLLRTAPMEDWRVTNKVGLAYGFVTENARVEHVPSGRVVFVAATLYVNPNGVMNDNTYGYDETSLPFMADLGEAVGRALLRDADESAAGE
ncbi:MAG: serine hydrolase [Planctomycetota bacterium]